MKVRATRLGMMEPQISGLSVHGVSHGLSYFCKVWGHLVQAGDLALVLRVLGELFGEIEEDGLALLNAAIAKLANGQHQAGERGQVVAMLGGERG